jgi:putative transposase
MSYASDVTDEEWAILEPLLYPKRAATGRPPTVERREVVDAIFSVLRTGCQWRYLPEGFPNWVTVYWYFKRWRDDGTWERVNDALRRRVRVAAGRDPEPSAGVVDSQSAKTTERGAIGATTPASRSRGARGTAWTTARAG